MNNKKIRHTASSALALAILLPLGCSGSSGTAPSEATEEELVFDGPACRVEYGTSDWSDGFTASVVVTNRGATKSNWKVEWDFGGNQKVSSVWDASLSQSGAHVVAKNVSWNGSLAKGGTISFGFNASFSGTNKAPTGFRLNGESCSGDVTPPVDAGTDTPRDAASNGDAGGRTDANSDAMARDSGSEPDAAGDAGALDSGSDATGDARDAGSSTGTCDAPQFTVGTAYGPKARVQNRGTIYECRPYPASASCGLSKYEPGVGSRWRSAWKVVGPCESTDGGADSGRDAGRDAPDVDAERPDTGGYVDAGEPRDSGSNVDADEPRDSGSNVDADEPRDSGSNVDAGEPRDSGSSRDSGTSRDAGSSRDSGTSRDAGGTVDAGGETPSGFAAVVSRAAFLEMFANPEANTEFYTYEGLVAATRSYPAFANTGSLLTRQREAAAFLANVAHETGELVFIEQIERSRMCQPNPECHCAPEKQYYGRGPLQLSWNYNYCSAGAALGINLVDQPELVATNSTIAWQTGLWFWNTESGAGTMTGHEAMTGGGGFGETIRSINGAIECNGGNRETVARRVRFYLSFLEILGAAAPEGNSGC